VALDAKRNRSAGTDAESVSTMGFMGTSVGVRNKHPINPPSPKTPQDEGVEVTAETSANIMVEPSTTGSFDSSEFAPNTNVDRFMMGGGDDDSTLFTDFMGSAFQNSAMNGTYNRDGSDNSLPQGAPPELPRTNTPELPRIVSPERVSSEVTDELTVATSGTGDPGRIVPKRAASKPNKMKIVEDMPFDEDIPFDERPAQSSTKGKSTQKKIETRLILPNMVDDLDDHSEWSEGSEETSNSEQVLEDLDKLSRFMMERKRSSKSQTSTASSRRRRKGGANMAISGSSGGGSSKRRGRPTK